MSGVRLSGLPLECYVDDKGFRSHETPDPNIANQTHLKMTQLSRTPSNPPRPSIPKVRELGTEVHDQGEILKGSTRLLAYGPLMQPRLKTRLRLYLLPYRQAYAEGSKKLGIKQKLLRSRIPSNLRRPFLAG